MQWRHEQFTLQIVLAAALRHSRDVGPESYHALRMQRTARAKGRGEGRDELRHLLLRGACRRGSAAGEEVDNHGLLHDLLVHQEQVMVQDIPEVPVSPSMMRATQVMDVEQVLDVPVLHAYDDDFDISSVQQLLPQEIPEVQVGRDPGDERRQQRRRRPEQVIAQEIPESSVLVTPQKRVQQRGVDPSKDRFRAKQVNVQGIPEVQVDSPALVVPHKRVQQRTVEQTVDPRCRPCVGADR